MEEHTFGKEKSSELKLSNKEISAIGNAIREPKRAWDQSFLTSRYAVELLAPHEEELNNEVF